jgi:CO dehydrogenase maturation factor
MAKNRYIDLKIQESLVEEEGFDLLVMGRPEGPGCYCYVNNLLRELTQKLIRNYDYVIVDNEAGMEHISRRTQRVADRLLVVSDYSIIGVRSAVRIFELAKEIGIKLGRALLVVNKATGDIDNLKAEIEKSSLTLAGTIPYDEDLVSLAVRGGSIFELKSQNVHNAVQGVLKILTEVPICR